MRRHERPAGIVPAALSGTQGADRSAEAHASRLDRRRRGAGVVGVRHHAPVLFADIAETSTRVAATRARTVKRDLLAGAIRAADATEIATVVSYLSGALRQRRTGLGWASIPAVTPAANPSLSVAEIDAAFAEIAAQSGAGSAARRSQMASALLARATPIEQHLLRGLIVGEVRQGALDALVQDALAAAFGAPAAAVRRAAMLLGSTTATAEVLSSSGVDGLAMVRLQVGHPVRPMLAAASPDVDGALARTGLPAVADAKLDGIRVQVHRHGDTIRVFTRSLDEITDRVPAIVRTVAALSVTDAVLDGEAVALDSSGRPLPFQITAARAAEKRSGATIISTGTGATVSTPTGAATAAQAEVSLSLFCFDLLRLNGIDLLDRPLDERADAMGAHLPPELIVPRIQASSAADVASFFADVIERGYEGVVVKRMDAGYVAGRRDPGWVKLKPRHTFDLAVTAAEWGYGRRTGYLSNLHLAARDPATGSLVMLGKTFKGLTDETLAWQTAEIQARASRRTRSTVYADPPLVAEIACDGLQASTRYPGGVALRFARVVRYRTDKAVADVDTIDTVRALAPVAES